MEANLSQGSAVTGGPPFGGLELQRPVRVHHQQLMQHHLHRQGSLVPPTIHEGFPLMIGAMHQCDQHLSVTDYNKKGDKCKSSMSDDDEPSEEGVDGQNDMGKGKKGVPWQRVKWTDKMVRLLITAVSYLAEDVSDSGGGMRRKLALLQKKGKWKLVSKVMAERGFHVSPQQCEDKFNDLNKRYKKLNDMLGRGISCQVVENPALLNVIDYLTEEEKDDVRKILSSKQLFYEEMCSYHNGNRLHLPHDPALQQSLQLALKSRDHSDNDDSRRQQLDLDEEDHEMETEEDYEEFGNDHNLSHGDSRGVCGLQGGPSKRLRQGLVPAGVCFGNPSESDPHISQAEINHVQVSVGSGKAAWLQKQWKASRALQLEEQKLQIQVEILELAKQQFKWQRFSKKRDRELDKMRMENERMKLENELMALELKRKEMGVDFNRWASP